MRHKKRANFSGGKLGGKYDFSLKVNEYRGFRGVESWVESGTSHFGGY